MSAVQLPEHEPVRTAPAPLADQGPLRFPSSIAQERFWAIDRLEPGSSALNIAVRWQLDGRVSSDLVQRAFEAIIARHEILRTAFEEIEGALVQVVAPSLAFRIAAVDLTALQADQALQEAERIGRAEARARFDPAQAPLLRVTLVRIAEQRTLLLLTVHHMVCDGWSIGVMAREFGLQYDAARMRRPAPLADLSIQYGDYARWHRERMRGGEFEADTAYWQRQLRDLTYLEIAPDRPHPPTTATGADIVGLLLDRTLTDGLQEFSRRHGNTLFVTALAALTILLNRYTGETDIAIGTQVIGRDEVELEDMVGVFINTLVLRQDVADRPGLAQLLHRTQEMVQAALDHQNLPMEQLIQLLQPKRDMTRNPFFSINFIFQRSFISNESRSEFDLVDLPSHSPGGLYDLNFFMVERPEGWRLSCEYNSDLFRRETVGHQLAALRCLLAEFVRNPDCDIAELPLLDAAEQARILALGRGASAAPPPRPSIHGLFERQVARDPRAPALLQGGRRMTYGELDRTANRLARHLRRNGLMPGMRVGLILPREADLLVSLLAVLKAGAGFVLFDADTAAGPLERMLREARLPFILTQGIRSELLDKAERVIALDPVRKTFAHEPAVALDVDELEDAIACAVFIQGRNERQGSVEITHRQLAHMLSTMAGMLPCDAGDGLVSVDAAGAEAVLELLLPLTTGARLVLASAAEAADGAALLGLLRDARATILQGRPAMWLRLLQAGWSGQPRLKMLCGGNESMTRALADRLLAVGGPLWSLYGEAGAIWTAVARVEPGEERPPLGQPLPGAVLQVIDRHGGLLPIGAAGELAIAGAGGPPRRTGEMVRRRDDGRIERLGGHPGRPVRVRGFLVEPTWIEDEILRHSGVAEACVVLMREAGQEVLAAFVVPNVSPGAVNPDLLTEALRIRLARAFARYMVPDAITLLPAMPLTADGHIDRARLGEPVEAAAPPEGRPAGAAIEDRLIALWSALLGRTDIVPTDDFFALGGHSLLAARLLAGIAREFGRKIDFASLFHAPTIRELARLLVEERGPDEAGQIVTVQPDGALPPVFAIDHTWIYDNLGRQLGPERPFFALPATLGRAGDGLTLQQMAADQIRTIRRQQPAGPYILLGLCTAGVLAFEIAQQLQDQGEAVPLLVMIDTWSPGYLQRQPPGRARLADWSYRWQTLVSDFRRNDDGVLQTRMAFVLSHLHDFVGRRLGRVVARAPVMLEHQGNIDRVALLDAAARTATQRPFTGRICLFHRESMPSGRYLDAQLGWGDLAAGGIEVHPLPGDHFSMFREPGVTTMATIVGGILDAERFQGVGRSFERHPARSTQADPV
ncbi:condensation domain-containing protein [Lichenicoccus sp.]|uniref:condensation domain-containing protein n=1 Tax=Lichenicoccus sp. TaxID=2781899 RepID=UPI003D0FC4F3